MQLLKSLEQINKEVRKELEPRQPDQAEIPEWKKEFNRIQAIVWENGRAERKEWVLKHKLKYKQNKQNKHNKQKNKFQKQLWSFKRMADEYSTYIY